MLKVVQTEKLILSSFEVINILNLKLQIFKLKSNTQKKISLLISNLPHNYPIIQNPHKKLGNSIEFQTMTQFLSYQRTKSGFHFYFSKIFAKYIEFRGLRNRFLWQLINSSSIVGWTLCLWPQFSAQLFGSSLAKTLLVY